MTFNYTSVQVHSTGINGKQSTLKKTIRIRNNKGIKKIEKYKNGKLISKGNKKLTADEITNISNQKFMPGLFNDCIFSPCKKHKKSSARTKRIAHKRH
jgi:hypothetical protein